MHHVNFMFLIFYLAEFENIFYLVNNSNIKTEKEISFVLSLKFYTEVKYLAFQKPLKLVKTKLDFYCMIT